MAAVPQPGWRVSLRDLRVELHHSVATMWAQRRLRMLTLSLWVLLLLCYYLRPGEYRLWPPVSCYWWMEGEGRGGDDASQQPAFPPFWPSRLVLSRWPPRPSRHMRAFCSHPPQPFKVLPFVASLHKNLSLLPSRVSNSGSANVLRNDDHAEQSLEGESIRESLLHFFFPTTCAVKEKQVVKPCNGKKDLRESECLRYKCCFSSSKTTKLRCFAPLRDKPTQMLRMFGVGVITMITLGFLPIYCCSLCRRR
ncbi:FMR1 neighbor protein [Lepus europaeus]|uniref:FMR1 neighbor protein n=1 Tax=Lepus europaeus TaxID=9983 RepID=UPI002B482418|nr:FMR1 neighbor protein [Lepus europaeus]